MAKYSEIYFTIIIFIFAISLRLSLYFFYDLPPELIPDTLSYTRLGFEFFELNQEYGKRFIFDSHVHMPLYSILSFLLGGRENLILLDIFLSASTSILIYLLAKELFNNRLISYLSALLFCINPFLVFFSISGLTETSYIFLLILFCLLICKKKYLFSFIVLIISIYIRPTIEVFYPIIILLFLKFYLKLTFFDICKKIVLYFIVYCVLMSPWWAHNYIKYDNKFVRLNLAPAWSLYIGNNELSTNKNIQYAREGRNEAFDLNKYDYLNSNPLLKNKKIRDDTLEFIYKNPIKFIELCSKRMLHFWQFYPNAIEFKSMIYIVISILSFGFICFFSILFFLNLNMKNFKKIIPFIFIILSINFVHVLTISSLRYRLPIEPFLIIFASNGVYLFLKLVGIKILNKRQFGSGGGI